MSEWVRLMSDRLWFGGPRLSRRDALLIEGHCIALAVVTFAATLLLPLNANSSLVRMSAVVPLACGYLMAASIRISDRYRLWPGSRNAPRETPPTWRSRVAERAFLITVGTLGTVIAGWLIVGVH
jgi:hypothetical protein